MSCFLFIQYLWEISIENIGQNIVHWAVVILKIIAIKQKIFYNKFIRCAIVNLICIKVSLFPIAVYLVITIEMHETNIPCSISNLMAFIIWALVFFIFIEIYIVKK